MTIQAITKKQEISAAIHTTAAEIVKLLDTAVAAVIKAGGNGDEALESILALVNDEDD